LAEPATTPRERIVSSDLEPLILVDEDDREVGSLAKAACHDGDGVLHRAFSLFIFNDDGELLLQQRHDTKRLWPGYWSNSCCSHPRAGETMDEAVHRRLDEELGMSADLQFLYKFQYHARFRDLGSENELCWVYLGRSDHPVDANPTEVSDHRWIAPADLDREMTDHPDRFTPWFRMEWERVREVYRDVLGFDG
jgi:isopentenyl-diphosphate delta-isomerase